MQFIYSTIDSTNLEALRWSTDNRLNQDVWFTAKQQTGGIGQRNRKWFSPLGGLYTSVLYSPPVSLSSFTYRGLITIAAGNTVYELVKNLLLEYDVDIQSLKIHWPNDIYYHGRKLSGILTQSATDNRLITGFGVNVNMTILDITEGKFSISLQEILHKNLDLSIILSRLQAEWSSQLKQVEQFVLKRCCDDYITQLETKLAWLDESVIITHTNESQQPRQTGILRGLTGQGALRLQTATGEQVIMSGSVRKADNKQSYPPLLSGE